MITSAACLKALLALCSPSAAITFWFIFLSHLIIACISYHYHIRNHLILSVLSYQPPLPRSPCWENIISSSWLSPLIINHLNFQHHHRQHHLGSGVPCSLGLGSHRPLQVLGNPHVFHLSSSLYYYPELIFVLLSWAHERIFLLFVQLSLLLSLTSTLSTRTPHGSVASSRPSCISEAMASLSERMSPRFRVPSTFLEKN